MRVMRLLGGATVMLAVVWAATPTVNQTWKPPTLATGEGGGTAQEFRWESPFQAARYRFTIRDVKGVAIFAGEVSAPPFRPDAALRSQLVARESYTWTVESLDSAGVTIGETMPVTLRYRP
jgi:hypothetical protein